MAWSLLLIKSNLIRLGSHAHGILTKTAHKPLPGGGEGEGVVGGLGMVGSQGVNEVGVWGGREQCHTVDAIRDSLSKCEQSNFGLEIRGCCPL